MHNKNQVTYFTWALVFSVLIDARHFNGGTIHWEPVNPNDTSNLITITITQTYYWTYPYIKCLTNVPASSGLGTVTDKLICVVDCVTSGNYSANLVSKLTDCISTDASTGLMISQRSVNVTLTKDAHFYIANVGTAWSPLGYPAKNNLEWSIVTNIDLRKRPDGTINTSPVATVVSPQYAVVNRPTEITIPVSDTNAGDDVRCRWSVYVPGYRRRRHEDHEEQKHEANSSIKLLNRERNVRAQIEQRCIDDGCDTQCVKKCRCTCPSCETAYCSGSECKQAVCSQTTTSTTTTTTDITTTETVGTPKSTSSYPVRQAINECGGICYLNAAPNDTTLSNCTISFTPTRVGVWYAFAIQVEDFIDSSSETPLSSVPVQFLVYVQPEPPTTSTTTTSSTTSTTSTTSTATTATTTSITTASTTSASTLTANNAAITTEFTTTIASTRSFTIVSVKKDTSWGLIAGICSTVLPLTLCCCCCLYWRAWSPSAKLRRHEEDEEEEENVVRYRHLTASNESLSRTTTSFTSEQNTLIEVPKKSYEVFKIVSKENNMNIDGSYMDNNGSILVKMYKNTNGRRSNSVQPYNRNNSLETGDIFSRRYTNTTTGASIPSIDVDECVRSS